MVSKGLKKMINREAMSLRQGIHDVLCNAAGGARKGSVDAPKMGDSSLSLNVG